MTTRPGPNSRAVASNHYKRTNQRFTAGRNHWGRSATVSVEQYEQSRVFDRETENQIQDIINAQSGLIDSLNGRRVVERISRVEDDGTRTTVFERFEKPPAPAKERTRKARREDAIRGRLARDAVLRTHGRRWSTYSVCPPSWDMSPAEYRRNAVKCAPGFTLNQLLSGMMVGGIALVGGGYGTGLYRGTAEFDWIPTILSPLLFLIFFISLLSETLGQRSARTRMAPLDPTLCVEAHSPEALSALIGFARPLDGTRKTRSSMEPVARQQVLERLYETAQQFAERDEADTPDTGEEAPVAPAVTELAERRRRWTLVMDRFETVDDAWAGLLTDPIAVLEHARLLDVSSPATATFIEAHGHARDLIGSRTRDEADVPPVETLREVETAVRAMATAWSDAKVRAQRAGYEWMPEADRVRARRATGFLAQAADKGLDWTARVTYAEKALALMRAIEVVPVPQPILRELAAASALALPPGTPAGPDTQDA